MALSIGVSSQGANNFANSVTTSPGVATQASGSTFAVFAVSGAAVGSPVTDNLGNTYTQIWSALLNGSTQHAYLYEVENGVGGAGHTWTFTRIAGSGSLAVFGIEIKSTSTFPTLDVGPTGNDNLANATSPATPVITTTANGDIILSGVFAIPGVDVTINDSTGFNNIIQSEVTGSSFSVVGAVGGLAQANAGNTSDTFTTTSINCATIIASWKASVAAAAAILMGGICL